MIGLPLYKREFQPSMHDLHAADPVYHHWCSNNLRTNKQIPAAYQTEIHPAKKLKLGRPQLQERTDAFLEVISYLEENDDEQITVSARPH